MRSFLPGLRKLRLFLASVVVSVLTLASVQQSFGQTLIAGWDFQTTTNGGTATAAATSTPRLYVSNVGTGTMYLDGTNGSSSWLQASELSAFTGTALNAGGATGLSTTTSGAASLAVLGGTSNAANGKSIVLKFSMTGLTNLVVTYATQKTGTGFNSQAWEYSTNGTTWTSAGTAVVPPASFAVQTLSTITALNNAATAYLRVTFTGSTGTSQNNRLDNIQLNATPPTTYAVTYNGNGNTGGSVPVDASSPYAAGATVTVKANTGTLVRTGYTFNGWNTAADGSGTAYAATGSATFTMPAAATVLYAQWTINTYTLTYDGNGNTGGSAPVDGSSPYNYNSNPTVLGAGTLTRTGYNFNGWNTAADGSGTSYTAGATFTGIAANTVLYAQWLLANSYSVTYNGNGSTGGTAPIDGSSPYLGGSNVTVLGAGSLVRTGYTFNGWNTAADGSGTAYAPAATISNISATTILYAQWTINTYTVTYDGNGNTGGTAPVDGGSPYNYNSSVTVLGIGTLTRTNYNFTGWNTAANGSGTAYSAGGTITGIAANTILYAQWSIITYAVTYNGNTNTGGTAPVDGSSPYATGSSVTVLGAGTLVKTGYTFANWNTAADGSGTTYAAGATISSIAAATTLFAQWTINTYTVTYDGNGNTGGTAPVDGSSPYNYNTSVTVLGNTGSLVKTGSTFNGWNTAANGSGTAYAPGASFTISANTTLYAQWLLPTLVKWGASINAQAGGTNSFGTSPLSPDVSDPNITITPLTRGAGIGTTGSGASKGWGGNNFVAASQAAAITASAFATFGLTVNSGKTMSISQIAPYNIRRSGTGPTTGIWQYRINTGSFVDIGSAITWGSGTAAAGNNEPAIDLSGISALQNLVAGTVVTFRVVSWGGAAAGSWYFNVQTTGTNDLVVNGTTASSVTYAVTYDGNGNTGGSATVDGNSPYIAGSNVTVLGAGTLTRTGYTFTGWNTAANGSGTSYSPGATISNIAAAVTLYAQWSINTYTLTYSAGANGSVTGASPQTVNFGASGTAVTAVPDANYHFVNWSDASTSNPRTDINVSANITVTANFAINTFNITASVTGGNGTIAPAGVTAVNFGGSQAYTITPNAGYHVADVLVDGVSQGAITTYTFSSVSTTHTIDASFAINTYTITASAGAGGSISPNGVTTVNSGAGQAYTISADGCSSIADVLVDGVSQGPVSTYTFSNVTANHTISVSFSTSTFTQWTGAVSTDWSDAANWSACVPDAGKFVYIPANGNSGVTQQPVLTADATTGDLEIDVAASITIGSHTLTIGGAYFDDGGCTLIGSPTSNLVFNSTATFSSTGTLVLKNLTVNGGTVTLASPVDITGGTAPNTSGSVTVANGAVLESAGFLTLKSNQFGTARVAPGDQNTPYLTGDVTVERYIPNNGFRAWRLLAVPTTGSQTIRQAWQEGDANPLPQQNNLPNFGAQISGTGTLATAQAAGFDDFGAAASLLSWTGTAWAGVPTTNAPFGANQALFLYIRGERSKGVTGATTNSSATTLRTKGALYNGGITKSVPANSFTLMPNPFASAIDFTQVERTGNIVKNQFYIWDSKKLSGVSLGYYQTFSATNGFQCLISGGSYTLGQSNTKIESGQAFFVSGGTQAGNVVVKESSKTTNSANLGFRPTSPDQLVKIDSRLYRVTGTDAGIVDANVVVFDNSYSNDIADEDAKKLTNSGENFGILKSTGTLVVEGRQPVTGNDFIQFNMTNMAQQTYRLEIAPANMGGQGLVAMLEDHYLNTNTVLSLDAATTIEFTIDANAASKAADRFRIVFSSAAPLPVSFISISANRNAAGVKVDWKVAAETNIVKYEVERSANGRNFAAIGNVTAGNGKEYSFTDAAALNTTAFYRVKSIGTAGEIKYTAVVKVAAGNVKPGFAISPNPVEGGIVNLQFRNQPKGSYLVKLISNVGQTILSAKMEHAGGFSTQLLTLPAAIVPGMYQVEILAADHTKTTQTVLVK